MSCMVAAAEGLARTTVLSSFLPCTARWSREIGVCEGAMPFAAVTFLRPCGGHDAWSVLCIAVTPVWYSSSVGSAKPHDWHTSQRPKWDSEGSQAAPQQRRVVRDAIRRSPALLCCPAVQVHDPSASPAIKENLKASEEKLKDAHQPL